MSVRAEYTWTCRGCQLEEKRVDNNSMPGDWRKVRLEYGHGSGYWGTYKFDVCKECFALLTESRTALGWLDRMRKIFSKPGSWSSP